jgi:hypothetical protein
MIGVSSDPYETFQAGPLWQLNGCDVGLDTSCGVARIMSDFDGADCLGARIPCPSPWALPAGTRSSQRLTPADALSPTRVFDPALLGPGFPETMDDLP